MSLIGKLSDARVEGRISEADVAAFQFIQAHADKLEQENGWLLLALELKEAAHRVTAEIKKAEDEK